MLNFTYYNPTKIVFGKGSIAQLPDLLPPEARVLMTYGGGSIKRNGVYEQVTAALSGRTVSEFGGIEPNPEHDTLVRAIAQARAERSDLLLAVGGGSVLDGTKFIAAALKYEGDDPWTIMTDRIDVAEAAPIGCVLTLPATGSEMNGNFVVSRRSMGQKLGGWSAAVHPQFSILDPESTYSLPPRQTANGAVDAFIHVTEQYLTYDVNAPLQARQAEAVLLTLIEEAPKALANPRDYDARANLMWCATNALNSLVGRGVPGDWASHMIGHELTALYGIDHGQSLAVVWPCVARHQRDAKHDRLLQYAERVWGLAEGDADARIDAALERTVEFFRSLGVGTTLSDYDIPAEAGRLVAERLASRGMILGEHKAIGPKEVQDILALAQ